MSRIIFLFGFLMLPLLGFGCEKAQIPPVSNGEEQAVAVEQAEQAEELGESDDSSIPVMAFFYQIVGAFKNGIGTNATLIGSTTDG